MDRVASTLRTVEELCDGRWLRPRNGGNRQNAEAPPAPTWLSAWRQRSAAVALAGSLASDTWPLGAHFGARRPVRFCAGPWPVKHKCLFCNHLVRRLVRWSVGALGRSRFVKLKFRRCALSRYAPDGAGGRGHISSMGMLDPDQGPHGSRSGSADLASLMSWHLPPDCCRFALFGVSLPVDPEAGHCLGGMT